MTREEAILCLKGMKNYARDTFTEQADWQDSLDIAIEALKAVEEIKEIINISNLVIQEDVLKYKMICEIIERMDEVENG